MVCLCVVKLLSPTCPGLVWVVILLHQLYLCHPITVIFFDHISAENRIWGDGFGTTLGGFRQFGAMSGGLRKACGRHHTQIYGLIHGATTHENSTTMSLYGYGMV
jgi:hypothetical protein